MFLRFSAFLYKDKAAQANMLHAQSHEPTETKPAPGSLHHPYRSRVQIQAQLLQYFPLFILKLLLP